MPESILVQYFGIVNCVTFSIFIYIRRVIGVGTIKPNSKREEKLDASIFIQWYAAEATIAAT